MHKKQFFITLLVSITLSNSTFGMLPGIIGHCARYSLSRGTFVTASSLFPQPLSPLTQCMRQFSEPTEQKVANNKSFIQRHRFLILASTTIAGLGFTNWYLGYLRSKAVGEDKNIALPNNRSTSSSHSTQTPVLNLKEENRPPEEPFGTPKPIATTPTPVVEESPQAMKKVTEATPKKPNVNEEMKKRLIDAQKANKRQEILALPSLEKFIKDGGDVNMRYSYTNGTVPVSDTLLNSALSHLDDSFKKDDHSEATNAIESIKFLLNNGAYTDNILSGNHDHGGDSALNYLSHIICIHNRHQRITNKELNQLSAIITQIITSDNFNIKQRGGFDNGEPLSQIACASNLENTKLLLEKDADVNALDKHGRNPLMRFLECGINNESMTLEQQQLVREYLKHDINTSHADAWGATIFDYARRAGREVERKLRKIVSESHVQRIKKEQKYRREAEAAKER